jgi:hypothetical protein
VAHAALKGAGWAFAALFVAACGGTEARPPARRPPEVRDTETPDLPDRNWGEVVSERFFVTLPLPDFAAFRVDDRSDRWLTATHLPSKSVLLLRSWREGSVVRQGDCEAQARRWRRDLFGESSAVVAERRPFPAPPDYATEVGFVVKKKGDALVGVAVMAGASVRRCLAVAYATRADGPRAETDVAERLAFVTERVFRKIETWKIEERVKVTPLLDRRPGEERR